MKTKQLTTYAMLIALYVVLAIIAPIKLDTFKFTFEAFPILVSGITLGELAGFVVGTLGSFIYQVLFSGYGLMLTTILWVIPHSVSGLLVGLYAKNKNYNLNNKQMIFITIISSLVVTTLNTISIIIDGTINNYPYTYAIVNIPTKIISGIILAIIYSLLIPKIIKAVKKGH